MPYILNDSVTLKGFKTHRVPTIMKFAWKQTDIVLTKGNT